MIDLSPFEAALVSLEEVLQIPVTPIIRDSTIQRFEYTYELAFKMLKKVLRDNASNPEQIDNLSYRDLLRVGAEQGLIDSPEVWFVYRTARNETSQGYHEEKAVVVYGQIGGFAKSARSLLIKLRQRIEP